MGAASAGSAQTAAADGAQVFKDRCARCHVGGAENVPTVEQLATRPQFAIVAALDTGKMRIQGDQLSPDQRRSVAAFLSKIETPPTDMSHANMCAGPAPLNAKNITGWNGWGMDPFNSRYQPASGINVSNVAKLKLKWVFGLPGTDTVYAQPTVIGGRVFFGNGDRNVYSLDANTGCTIWTFNTQEYVRSAITVEAENGRPVAFFGDVGANVYAVDANSGKLIWKLKVEDHPLARITGPPTWYQDRLYVPVGSTEPSIINDPKYNCCTFRGSVVAIDAKTGKQIWKSYSVPTPPVSRGLVNGTEKFGPSGAPIWSAPTIDPKLKLVYAGTGDAYSDPDVPNADSIIAFDLATGRIRWAKQFTSGDSASRGCVPGGPVTCNPGKITAKTLEIDDDPPDVDFASATILRDLGNGKRILLAPQKSGIIWGLDPDQQGKILWWVRVGKGGALGGILWGSAADLTNAYVANGDSSVETGRGRGPKGKAGGLFSIRLTDGKTNWSTPSPAASCSIPGCGSAQNQAVTLVPGVVFSGTMDGHMRAYSAEEGKIIWDFDTRQEFKSVNGVPTRGGSLSSSGATVVGNMLFVGSGYGALLGVPGNAMLAFEIEK